MFDLCVHQSILTDVLADFVAIGAKNFILPKPLALTHDELALIETIANKFRLQMSCGVAVALRDINARSGTLRCLAHKARIARAEIEFSRPMEPEQRARYTPATALLPHMLQILLDSKVDRRHARSRR